MIYNELHLCDCFSLNELYKTQIDNTLAAVVALILDNLDMLLVFLAFLTAEKTCFVGHLPLRWTSTKRC